MEDYTREACPYRILDETGGAFTMGFVGGALFRGLKGFYNAPSGFRRRASGSLAAMKIRAPLLGGNFAAWGTMYGIIDCTLKHIRGKDDPWNSIISGAVANGALAARSGLPAMVGGAISGGMILGCIEASNMLFMRFAAETPKRIGAGSQIA